YYYLDYKAMGGYGSSGVAVVKDGYLYIASASIFIYDIDPLNQAHFVAWESMYSYYDWIYDWTYYTTATAIGVSDSIAFVWGLFKESPDLYLFNIDHPENLSTISRNTLSDVGYWSVKVQNGYVYYTAQQNLMVTTDGLGGLNFVPGVPENGTVWLDDDILGVYGKTGDVTLLNIENNEYPYIASTIEGPVYSATSNDGYAVLENLNFQTWDIDPPETPIMLGEFNWIQRTGSLCRSGDYLYVSVKRVHHGDNYGLLIIDISQPEQPVILKFVPTEYHLTDLDFEKGFLFCTSYYSLQGSGRMSIFDVDPIENAHVTGFIEIPEGVPMFINVHDGYAYLVTYNDEFLYIYDIDPLSTAYLVSTTELGIWGGVDIGVAISDDYVYATDHNGRLNIISLDPPDNPQIVKTLEFDEHINRDILYSNGLLFLPQYGNSLKIVDVDPPEEAHLINEIYGTATQCFSGNGEYIFIGDKYKGTQIIDVMPPENAHIFSTIDIDDYTISSHHGRSIIAADDKYAYISGYYSGLQIVELY
ncbi:hypothetical protein KAU08_00225, partial [bacterium]|nr:hypothetical protein [bacterium]